MRVRLFAAALLFALPSARGQELQLFDPGHEARFAPGSTAPVLSSGLPETAAAALAAFAEHPDLRLVLASAPGDALGETRRRAAVQALRERGVWPDGASRGVDFAEDGRIGADRLRFGLRSFAQGDPACAGFELHVGLPQFFGDRPLKLEALRAIALPAGARVEVRRKSDGGLEAAAVSPPARIRLEEGASRATGDMVASYMDHGYGFSAPAAAPPPSAQRPILPGSASGVRSVQAEICEIDVALR